MAFAQVPHRNKYLNIFYINLDELLLPDLEELLLPKLVPTVPAT